LFGCFRNGYCPSAATLFIITEVSAEYFTFRRKCKSAKVFFHGNNPAFLQMSIISPEGFAINPLIPASCRTCCALPLAPESAIKKGKVVRCVIVRMRKESRRKDGTWMWGYINVSAIRDEAGKLLFAVGMLADITQEKAAQAEISAYQERLRALASELSLTEERERRLLAADLHDHIGQILALAQIKEGSYKEVEDSSLYFKFKLADTQK
jgi:signal transduction histidine kinase